MQLLSCVLVVCVAVVIQLPGQTAATPSPIILLPGIMGSQLRVMDEIPGASHKVCRTGRKYKELWISPFRIILQNICAKTEVPLEFNPADNTYHNASHVKIEVPGFGDTKSVENLNPGWVDTIEYFETLVKYFVDRGYKRGKSIRGAPYDWRLAADELERTGYFNKLKALVEDTYNKNGRTKVTLVVHSMGGPVSLHFLTSFVSQAWKNKYIHAYVTLAAAWSGGVGTLQTVISGAHDIPDFLLFASNLIANFIIPITRTFESLPWLFPKPSVFGNDVLISTPSKDYTASDYEDLFRSVGYTNGYRFYQHVQAINPNYPAPNVRTHCLYGVDVKTAKRFNYKKDFGPGVNTIGWKPKVVNGDGDGSVNTVSAEVCKQWSGMASFSSKSYSGATHTSILKDSKVLSEIASIVGAPKKKKSLFSKLFGRRK